MTEFEIGILAAVIGAILLGSYIAFVRLSKLSATQFLLLQLVFAAITALVILLYTKELFSLSLQEAKFPIIAGVMFSLALSLVFFSIKTIGIGTSSAIYVGLQLVVAIIIGFVFFNELSPLSYIQRIETVSGVILVLVGISLISIARL